MNKKDPNKLTAEYLTEVGVNVSIQNGNPSCKLSYASPIDTPPHKTGVPMELLDELERELEIKKRHENNQNPQGNS